MSGGALLFGLIVFGIGPFWLRRVFQKAREKEAERNALLAAKQKEREAKQQEEEEKPQS